MQGKYNVRVAIEIKIIEAYQKLNPDMKTIISESLKCDCRELLEGMIRLKKNRVGFIQKQKDIYYIYLHYNLQMQDISVEQSRLFRAQFFYNIVPSSHKCMISKQPMSPNLALGRFIRAPLPDTLHKEIKPNISVFGSIKKFNGKND